MNTICYLNFTNKSLTFKVKVCFNFSLCLYPSQYDYIEIDIFSHMRSSRLYTVSWHSCIVRVHRTCQHISFVTNKLCTLIYFQDAFWKIRVLKWYKSINLDLISSMRFMSINFHIVIIRTLPYRIQMKVKLVADST